MRAGAATKLVLKQEQSSRACRSDLRVGLTLSGFYFKWLTRCITSLIVNRSGLLSRYMVS
jgi:hypothetical protein